MSGLLFGAGAFAIVAGAVMIGFGIPVNEFSFGNTLIVAGVTALVGGLIVVGLGVVVSQLQRIAEALSARTPIKSSRPLDMFNPAGSPAPAPAKVAFPSRPKSDAAAPRELFSPAPMAAMPKAETPAHDDYSFAPSLRNPDRLDHPEESPMVEDDVSLSPQHPMSAPPQPAAERDEPEHRAKSLFDTDTSEMTENRVEPTLDAGWRPSPPPAAARKHTTYFDAMWPAEKPAIKDETETAAYVPPPEPEPDIPEPKAEEPVAILKSGVVDGMGYTLYVDGSIEAELPQGTLRFASINELRSHLEKNA
jgi:hypothetical protein